ncbi:MAG: GNAT family N-acetyltransferase [Puniceicoccales bacterium]|jgi:ribosomal-protein-alanine N-acetyltransferase|nr:GNAT family N-acetyltransferase [Puniceicoccales bacterium]
MVELETDSVDLETERLKLRVLRADDEDDIVNFMAERGVTEFLLFFTYPIQRQQVHAWLENVLAAPLGHCIYWSIVDPKINKTIGIISLTRDQYHRKGEIGYWLAKEYWGRGLMTEVVWRVIQYCFDTLRLHRLELTHMVANKASQRVAEKVGFQLEGCWREGHWKEGRFLDVKIYGMLDVDYVRTKKHFAAAKAAEVAQSS